MNKQQQTLQQCGGVDNKNMARERGTMQEAMNVLNVPFFGPPSWCALMSSLMVVTIQQRRSMVDQPLQSNSRRMERIMARESAGRVRLALAAWLARRCFLVVAVLAVPAVFPQAESSNQAGPGNKTGDSKPLRIRRNVSKLSLAEKRELIEAILKLKKARSPFDTRLSYYDQFVSWHLAAQCCPRPEHPDTPWPSHFNPAIWPWHRIMLVLFERGLQEVSGKPLALPYWDWTDPASVDVVFAEGFMGPRRGDPKQNYVMTTGPFQKDAWQLNVISVPSEDPGQSRWLVRAFGLHPRVTQLPTRKELADALALKDYDVAPFDITSDPERSFRARLDGAYGFVGEKCSADGVEELMPGSSPRLALHSAVHHFVGGQFKVRNQTWYGTLKTRASPNDPVFWLHHAFLDKIWADWMARHGRVYLPEKEIPKTENRFVSVPGLKSPLRPYDRVAGDISTPQSVLDHHKLGYAFDTDQGRRRGRH